MGIVVKDVIADIFVVLQKQRQPLKVQYIYSSQTTQLCKQLYCMSKIKRCEETHISNKQPSNSATLVPSSRHPEEVELIYLDVLESPHPPCTRCSASGDNVY